VGTNARVIQAMGWGHPQMLHREGSVFVSGRELLGTMIVC